MRERLEQILKIICAALALLLLVQFVKVARRVNPLSGVVVPQLPSLPEDTNAPVKVAGKEPIKSATNAPMGMVVGKSNASVASLDTNIVSAPKTKGESNSAPIQTAAAPALTNSPGTNVLAAVSSGTNKVSTNSVSGTNAVVELAKTNQGVGTNSVLAKAPRAKRSGPMPPSMMMMGPGGRKAPSLPPAVQARVDRVTESEILGPVIHPMPMALLGIAGNVAFLRSPSGQTGLVKEGEELGEIKLLRIGINRVLIEQDGQKKELTIFSGFGGESLLPKTTGSSDETTKN